MMGHLRSYRNMSVRRAVVRLSLYFLFAAPSGHKLFSDFGKLWIRHDRARCTLALLILEALGAKYVIFVTARRNRISTLTEFCEVLVLLPQN